MNLSTGSARPGLRVEGIAKSYGDNRILDDLTFDVERGKLLSLLGPSGCGKTTTLNMIAGFDKPDEGRIILEAQDITDHPPNRRDTAIVFQNYALFPHMTVHKNISYGLKVRKTPTTAAAERVQNVLELLDIAALGDRYPGELSGGQQQRVSLARAIAVRPSLLLLDEPLSNLDAKLRQSIRLEIRRLQQELEQTAVFVTHDQEEALVISDYIAVLNRGRLEQYGTPEELWESPETVYVADFMGVENILPVEGVGDGASALGGRLRSHGGIGAASSEFSHFGFRPGRARLSPVGREVSGGGLAIRTTITSKAYMGTHFRYSCQVGGAGSTLEVDQAFDEEQFDPGEQAEVEIAESGMLPLRESGSDVREQGDK